MADSETINKSLAELNKKIEDMKKAEGIVNGAVDEMVQQFQPKAGSGTTGSVPLNTFASGGVNDGVKVQEKKDLTSKAGSGAGVGEQYLGQGKEGKNVNNAAFGTKEVMTKAKACGGKMPSKPKGNIKGKKGGIANNKTAKVPAPKGGLEKNKMKSKKA